MGLICGGIEVDNGKVQRIGAGLTNPRHAKMDRVERSAGIVRGWRICAVSIQPLPFAVVCVRLGGTMQHVEAICYGGELVQIVTLAIVVFITAGGNI